MYVHQNSFSKDTIIVAVKSGKGKQLPHLLPPEKHLKNSATSRVFILSLQITNEADVRKSGLSDRTTLRPTVLSQVPQK